MDTTIKNIEAIKNEEIKNYKIRNQKIHPDIKKQILNRIKEQGVSVNQAAQEHGISNRTIYGWMYKGDGPSQLELIKLRRENQALLKLIGELTRELSKSKKNNRY